MSDFLWEIGCEEIPARMQKGAQETLERLVMQHSGSLIVQGIKTWVTPRRLGVRLSSVFPVLVQAVEKQGPLVDLGEKAFAGFCRTHGVQPKDCIQVLTPKGVVWSATLAAKQEPVETLLVQLCTTVLSHIFWPKRMVWSGDQSWIRPIRWMVTLYGQTPLEWSFNGVPSGSWSEAHRLAPHKDFFDLPGDVLHQNGLHSRFGMRIVSPETYAVQLAHSGVLIDHGARSERIAHDVQQLAKEQNAIVCRDTFDGLVEENAGLTQWPVVVLCQFDAKYLCLPPEVIITTLQVHQKCFSLRCAEKPDQLLPYFIMIADGPVSGAMVRQGYERVVDARLSDALFFWTLDLKTPLDSRIEALADRSFFQGLGTLRDKTLRLKGLMSWIADHTGQQDLQPLAQQVAMFSKCDLLTAMVGEFPVLQGVMGRYYAEHHGVNTAVAYALQQAYSYGRGRIAELKKSGILGAYLAIADGMDTLVGFFALNRIPSGSKDPMALRRTCQAVIKAKVAHQISLDLPGLIAYTLSQYQEQGFLSGDHPGLSKLQTFFQDRLAFLFKDNDLLQDSSTIKLLCTGRNIWNMWEQAEQLATLLNEHSDFISAYRRVYALVQQMQDEQSTHDFSILNHPLERALVDLLSIPCTVDVLPGWTGALNAFLDRLKVQEQPFEKARLSLLCQVLNHCSVLGPLALAM
ncbi:MAG: glycine--tRNA ligase subunit beta [Alphaproteobacteria bacterium]|nr:glycine--tRNA ligase subunit beta [Alphaproteobacteria bacterium]